MCGIFGLLNNNVNVDVQHIIKSFEKGSHRGPEFSIYKKVMVKTDFGFHRLAINGLDEISHQPIILGDIVLICNGEIYNYLELRKNLVNLGEIFVTNSDTEVLIKYYKIYGEECVKFFEGMWSFVIYDTKKNNFFASRDRFGEKPFFYYFH